MEKDMTIRQIYQDWLSRTRIARGMTTEDVLLDFVAVLIEDAVISKEDFGDYLDSLYSDE